MHSQWFSQFEPEAAFRLKGRLHRYVVLRAFKEKVNCEGLARAQAISDYLEQYPNYFHGPSEYRRWLFVTSYREALRMLPPLEPIETILEEMPSESRRLVRWSYIDQLTEQDIARMLCLETKTRMFVDDVDARRRIVAAYDQLCGLIVKRHPAEAFVPSGRYLDYSIVFPAPPNISRVPKERRA